MFLEKFSSAKLKFLLIFSFLFSFSGRVSSFLFLFSLFLMEIVVSGAEVQSELRQPKKIFQSCDGEYVIQPDLLGGKHYFLRVVDG